MIAISKKNSLRANKILLSLFNVEAVVDGLEEAKKDNFLNNLHKEIKAPDGRAYYLTCKNLKKFLSLIEIVQHALPESSVLDSWNVEKSCRTVLGEMYGEGNLGVDVQQFLSSVQEVTKSVIKSHRFYTWRLQELSATRLLN